MSDLSNPLIGAWRLVSFETRFSTGETAYPFGSEAVGALVYTVEGLVCATVCRPDRPRFAPFDAQSGLQTSTRWPGGPTSPTSRNTRSTHRAERWNTGSATQPFPIGRVSARRG